MSASRGVGDKPYVGMIQFDYLIVRSFTSLRHLHECMRASIDSNLLTFFA